MPRAKAAPATVSPRSRAKDRQIAVAPRKRLPKFPHQTTDPLAPIDSVQPHPQNPNQGDLDEIEESVDANGFIGWIDVQRSTGFILAGEHRWRVLKRKGSKTAPINYVDLDDDAALGYLLAHNAVPEKAKRDPDRLAAALLTRTGGDPRKLLGTGYRGSEAARELLERAKRPPPEPEDDDIAFSGADEPPADEDDAPASEPPTRADDAGRFALAIVLSKQEMRDVWGPWRDRVGSRTDKRCWTAAMKALKRAEERGLLDELMQE
jgi:ParB-like chromosome segregation protein Spo0J